VAGWRLIHAVTDTGRLRYIGLYSLQSSQTVCTVHGGHWWSSTIVQQRYVSLRCKPAATIQIVKNLIQTVSPTPKITAMILTRRPNVVPVIARHRILLAYT